MRKSTPWKWMALVSLGWALASPPAQASELVKLGKLIVTGKRAPAIDPRAAVAAPNPAEQRLPRGCCRN
jgi:hypothetical protein